MIVIPAEELRELYIDQNMRRSEVAEHFGCSVSLIKQKIKMYGLQKPHHLEVENKKRAGYIKNCGHCGMQYETRSRNAHAKRSRFCSQECSQKSRYLGEEHHRAQRNHHASLYRARLKNNTPELTEEEKQQILEIYSKCPRGYEVDHIIPISKGGAHHPNNLQYLTMPENRRKGSKI